MPFRPLDEQALEVSSVFTVDHRKTFEKLNNLLGAFYKKTCKFYVISGLDETLVSVSISRSKFLVSVSSRSRKIILQKSRSCLGLEKRLIKNSCLESRVFRVKF